MRIISGTAKGRRLQVPSRRRGRPLIRPTSDRAREAIFSIIGTEVVGAAVLDLFAGTGALGLEALSRGAGSALFVDQDREALALVAANAEVCGFSDQGRIVRRDLARGLGFLAGYAPENGFALVFIDPPYGRGLGVAAGRELADLELLDQGALVVIEDAADEVLPGRVGRLVLSDRRRYGDTGFWLFRPQEGVEPV